MSKKGATRQSFIRKEITTYRIGTLVRGLEEILKYSLSANLFEKKIYLCPQEKLAPKIRYDPTPPIVLSSFKLLVLEQVQSMFY